jgi:Arm DNA-binding domain/Phage integrase central domain/Phage integrase family
MLARRLPEISMHVKLTPAFVKNASAPATGDRAVFWDEGMEGFALVVMASGHRSYVVQYRANGVSRRYTLDGKLSLSEARKKARGIQGKVANGHDPVVERRKKKAEATNTLQAIGDEYLARVGKKLRSYKERKRILEKYVWPRLGSRQIDEIRRVEVIRLLDKVEDENGPVMADHVLAILRRLMSWHAARAEDFRTPLVKGMGRAAPARERARQRVLSDQELRAVWYAAETSGTAYGALVQLILLTATRLREAAHMTRDELSVDGKEWVIPGSRHKSKKDFLVPLSQPARDVLAKLPVIGRKGWVFTTDGERIQQVQKSY